MDEKADQPTSAKSKKSISDTAKAVADKKYGKKKELVLPRFVIKEIEIDAEIESVDTIYSDLKSK